MNGLSISILIETGNVFPKGTTSSHLQKQLKKSKTTILDQTAKLIQLGYLSKNLDLLDIRKKPLVLTERGFSFIYQLYSKLLILIKEAEKIN